jgi:hypothetical protein
VAVPGSGGTLENPERLVVIPAWVERPCRRVTVKPGAGAHACNPSYSGAEIRRIAVQSQPGETVLRDPISKKGS